MNILKRTYTIKATLVLMMFTWGGGIAEAAQIKVLSDSAHAFSTIASTVNQLLGAGHVGVDVITHYSGGTFTTNAQDALNTTATYYDQNGTAVLSVAPYQLFTTSATGYSGDTVAKYNTFTPLDVAYNYAYSSVPAIPTGTPPPVYYFAPVGAGWVSGPGVEWTLDPTIFTMPTLSEVTATNAGMISSLRYLHSVSTSTPAWNWFDVKAALRQTGSNWATGYNPATFGFGQVNYASAVVLTNNQIQLQPPVASATYTGVSNQITFTLYPFKQTRRIKEVLFQFPTAPVFHGTEFNLAGIQAVGGTKITEYTGTLATTIAPIYTPVNNGYFVWFTADNANDNVANFSRIDTYSVLGPLSQGTISFNTNFDIISPTSNSIFSGGTPVLKWSAPTSFYGISKYQLFVDGVLNRDNIIATSSTPLASLAPGTHTWYVKAFSGNGGATTTISTPVINIVAGYNAGFTFYVDNVLGNDNNPGSSSLPWATLTKAANTVNAGDTVIVIKNTNQPYRETLQPTHNGTASSYITFRGIDAKNKPEIWGSVDTSSGWSVYTAGAANTYQHAFTKADQTYSLDPVVAVGASVSTLSKRTKGASATTLTPGQWFWSAGTLYYRLAPGEVMGSLQIEVGTRGPGIISLSNYLSFQNFIVRYADQGVQLSGSNEVLSNIEVYDSNWGVYMGGRSEQASYLISARNVNEGIYLYPLASNGNTMSLFNSLAYGNGTSGYVFFENAGTKINFNNNISAGNAIFSFSFDNSATPTTLSAANNMWDIAGDINWTPRKGINNKELVNPLFTNTATGNFSLQPFSPAIDAGTTTISIATDSAGDFVYGTPDVGPREYQPPYVTGINSIDTTGNIRLYADGKYRYTTATSTGTTASMMITPTSNASTGNYGEFLNISVNKWNKTGDYSKKWIETANPTTPSAIHTVGDLKAGTYYSVFVDSVKYTTMLSNGNGQGTFTYIGGYSLSHTFDVVEGTPPPSFMVIAPAGFMNSRGTIFSWNAATTESSGLAKYQLFIDGILVGDNIVTNAMRSRASMLSCGDHTWYVVAIDGAGNSISSNTQAITVACETGVASLVFALPATPNTMPARNETTFSDPTLQSIATSTLPARISTTTIGIITTGTTTATSSLHTKYTKTTKITSNFTRTLKRGVRGSDVVLLQKLLKNYPVLYPEGTVNGIFGPATERAVKRLQKRYKLNIGKKREYGIVGPNTRTILNKMLLAH